MATFEKLPAKQQTILELVINRGQPYQALSVVFDEPPEGIRTLAHEALASLAPTTYSQVDPAWQEALADYVLGQQADDDLAATRSYIAHSETARSWVASLVDSLDHLFADKRPEIPTTNGSGPGAEDAPPGPTSTTARVAASLAGFNRFETPAAGKESQPPSHGAAFGSQAAPAAMPEGLGRQRSGLKRGSGGLKGTLSPAARAIVRRRRIVGAIVAVCAVIGLGYFGYTLIFGGGSQPATPAVHVLRQVVLNPLDPNSQNVGAGIIAQQGGQNKVVVQAKLDPPPNGQAYEVWLYNSPTDVVPLGYPQPNQQGLFQGVGDVPPNYANYRNIDISLQNNGQQQHSGHSVLRGTLDLPPPPGQPQAPAAPGTPQAPAPGTPPAQPQAPAPGY